MLKKYPKFVLFLVLFCLIGAGVFYFSDTWQEDETQTQTVQNLKLLNSHSHPEAGDEWTVSFETIGTAGLTIVPTDSDSIGDLDFVSLSCDGKEKTEEEPLQILEEDVIFYPDWQCAGTGELIHLVNIARKHILKFQFSNKIAFAYNNPDSVTDTFTDESKVSATSSVVVTGGQATLATCTDNGGACAVPGDCCSGFCVDGVCCNTACTGSLCQRCDSYSNAGAGTCGYVSSSSEDPDHDCTAKSCTTIVLNSASGIDCDDKCAAEEETTGHCSGSGLSCASVSCSSSCVSIGTNAEGNNASYYVYLGVKTGCDLYESAIGCRIEMQNNGGACSGHQAKWTNCLCN